MKETTYHLCFTIGNKTRTSEAMPLEKAQRLYIEINDCFNSVQPIIKIKEGRFVKWLMYYTTNGWKKIDW